MYKGFQSQCGVWSFDTKRRCLNSLMSFSSGFHTRWWSHIRKQTHHRKPPQLTGRATSETKFKKEIQSSKKSQKETCCKDQRDSFLYCTSVVFWCFAPLPVEQKHNPERFSVYRTFSKKMVLICVHRFVLCTGWCGKNEFCQKEVVESWQCSKCSCPNFWPQITWRQSAYF